MNTKTKIKNVLKGSPEFSNSEIADATDLKIENVKMSISRMKKTGEIEDTSDGKGTRHLMVTPDPSAEMRDFKEESYLQTVNQLLRANENETNSYELRQNGALIVRILERL